MQVRTCDDEMSESKRHVLTCSVIIIFIFCGAKITAGSGRLQFVHIRLALSNITDDWHKRNSSHNVFLKSMIIFSYQKTLLEHHSHFHFRWAVPRVLTQTVSIIFYHAVLMLLPDVNNRTWRWETLSVDISPSPSEPFGAPCANISFQHTHFPSNPN